MWFTLGTSLQSLTFRSYLLTLANVLALPHVSILPSEFLICPPHFLASVGLLYPHG